MLISLAALALSSALGAALVRTLLDEDDPYLTWGSGCLAALLIELGLTQLLRPLIGYGPGALVGLAMLTGAGLTAWLRGPRRDVVWPDLARSHKIALVILTACAYFAMHTHEVKAPEDDFFIHFPLISLLARGHYPPLNPFFAQLPLFGHFGRDMLISLLTHLDGNEILPATWALNHALQLASLALAIGLGYRSAKARGAVLLPWFLFCGISVGSRAGLIDTYDNNNGLVYAGLLMLVHWLVSSRRKGTWALLGFLLGTYAIVYETHMLLFVTTMVGFGFFAVRSRVGVAFGIAVSLVTAAFMGGPVQDLAMRLLHLRQTEAVGHVEAYESQRVEMHIPKAKFLQIELGNDSYRRLSLVFESKFLQPLAPALDEGGYTYIFAPKVLAIHWLGTWLGFLSLLILVRRRDAQGLTLWLFGLGAYLAPGVVDFGPVHEKEYFRWEFAAGFCWSGALAISLAHFWEGGSRGRKVGLALLIAVALLGGERRVNQAWIWVQRGHDAALWKPWYPGQRSWLLAQPDLHLKADEIDLAVKLHARLGLDDRVLTDIDARGQWDFFREATLAGLLGVRVVGQQSPPRWMPDGIAPYFHTPNWSVLWQRQDPRALIGTEASWLFTTTPQPWLANCPQVSPGEHLGEAASYQILPGPATQEPPPGLAATLELAQDPTPQSEVAVPLKVHLRAPVKWLGVWHIRCSGEARDPVTDLALLAGVDGQDLELWFVPPLHEGPTHIEVLAGSSWVGKLDFANPVKGLLAGLQREPVRWRGREGEENKAEITLRSSHRLSIAGSLRLGWRIYDKVESRYQTPYGFDGYEPIRIDLKAGEAMTIKTRIRYPEPADRFRIDFFLWTYTGAEVPLGEHR